MPTPRHTIDDEEPELATDRLLRDNLDENGCGSRSVEAAAGSEVMIVLMIELRRDFLWSPFFDCR